jgi:single-strand DNA-binding protein
VYIEGRIRTRSWDDQTGNKRYTTEIIADNLQLLGKKSDNPGAQQGGYSQQGQTYQQPAQGYQQPGYAPAAQQPAFAQPAQPSYQPQQPQAYSQPQPAQPVDITNDGPEDDLPF